MVRSPLFIQFNKAATVLEFTFILIVAIMAYIGIQAMLKRGIQGRLRSSADSLGDQFSPRWTNTSKVVVINYRTNESTSFGNVSRSSWRNVFSDEDVSTDTPKAESAELRSYF